MHDAKKCDAIPLDDLRVGCTRDATRFRGVLIGNAGIASVPQTKGTLTLSGDGKPQATADLDFDVGSGVVVVLDGKKTRVTFGRVGEISATPRAAQPLDRTRLALAFATSADKPAEITEAALTVPGSPIASCTACTLSLKIDKLEPKRAGTATIVLDGTLGTWKIHADVQTFVRDVTTR